MKQKQTTKSKAKQEETQELEAKKLESGVEDSEKLLDEIDELLEVELEEKKKEPSLADLMREGAALADGQAFGSFVTEDNKVCALGAAYLAARQRGMV